MKSRNVRVLIVVAIALLIISFNAFAFNASTVYLPLVFKQQGITEFPSPSPSPTSTSTVPAPPAATGLVEIRDILFDPPGSDEGGEYVVIENDESFPIQLLNWTLRDEANHVFTFPSFVIQPNQQCRIYTNEYHPDTCGFNYGSSTAIWNNGGDTAYLRDSNGTLIDDYSY